jgi:hypothetical protein
VSQTSTHGDETSLPDKPDDNSLVITVNDHSLNGYDHSLRLHKTEILPIAPSGLVKDWGTMYMLLFARDDLTGWVEGKAIPEATSYDVAKFLYEEVLCRHGCPRKIIMDWEERESRFN